MRRAFLILLLLAPWWAGAALFPHKFERNPFTTNIVPVDATVSNLVNEGTQTNWNRVVLERTSGTNAFIVNTNQLVVTNGFVGIGTNAPINPLHVNGHASVDGGVYAYTLSATNGAFPMTVFVDTDGDGQGEWNFIIGAMINDNSVSSDDLEDDVVFETVGIGTNAPVASLHIRSGSTNALAVDVTGNGAPATPGTVLHWIPFQLNGTNGFIPFYQ